MRKHKFELCKLGLEDAMGFWARKSRNEYTCGIVEALIYVIDEQTLIQYTSKSLGFIFGRVQRNVNLIVSLHISNSNAA
jgi:hypothetical protein